MQATKQIPPPHWKGYFISSIEIVRDDGAKEILTIRRAGLPAVR
jgi:hypothetical protein